MKTLKRITLLFILLITLGACTKEESCECNREVYELDTWVDFSHGPPHQHFDWVLQRTEPVLCQDEVLQYTEFDDKLYFKIICN